MPRADTGSVGVCMLIAHVSCADLSERLECEPYSAKAPGKSDE